MTLELCVAARDLNSLIRYVGPFRLISGWSAQHAVLVDSQTGPQLWLGAEKASAVRVDDLWRAAYPNHRLAPGYKTGPVYEPQSAAMRGFGYVRVALRPKASALDRWVPQKMNDDPLLWAIFSSPESFR